ncbi:MAG: DMT family transporter [Pseudomonadota bacterium]|jgi:drug/metabolite transporter (DMT)-like permease|nr:DMT family transporter [Pseudomonadota bacterium]NLX30998.1 DMT family transporter [Deltaproteobacteria bacterium]HNU86442.1 DMT family transporter [Syntrophales bacterium]HNZ35877.1 DMT family transporter [Syntrophales bacterium]HOF74065.1 DMT family transporter [Syntrophales bacterium]
MIYLKLFLTAVFWGGTFIAGRILAQEVQPWSGSFLRFLVASVGMIPLVWHFEGRLQPLRKKEVLLVFLSGMTGVFLYNVFFLTGLQTVQAGRASVIVASNPVLISLFAALLFRGERMTPRKILGVALSVCGAVFVITRGHPEEILQGAAGRGEMFIFGCVASWVSYSLIGKVVMRDVQPVSAVTYACLVGASALLPPALIEGMAGNLGSYSIASWLSIVYLGFFGTCIGFIWYYEGIREIGPSRAGVFINFVPISAVVLSFFLLGETVDASLLIGTALVLSGIYLANRSAGGS